MTKSRQIYKIILFIIVTVIFGKPATSQSTVKIAIDVNSEKKAISPYIFGKNNNLSDKPTEPLSDYEWQRLRDAGVRLFRDSGGNNSTKYNWKRKLTSHPDWYNNVFPHDWSFEALSLQENIPEAQGMWAFQLIGKAAKSGAYNFSSWNYNKSQWWDGVHQNLCGGGVVNPNGGGDALQDGNTDLYLEDWPADSVVKILNHWVEDKQLDSTKFRYWGMDNEPEIWVGTHDDVMPEQLQAEEFMQRYFEVAKKAKAYFPGIKLCGPVPANEWQWYNWDGNRINYKGGNYVWLEYFILRVAEEQNETGIRLLDVLDIHFYPGDTKNEDILQLHRVYFDRTFNYPQANGVKRIGGWDNSITKEYIFGRCEDWLKKYMGENHGVTFGVTETGIKSDNPNIIAPWYASTLGEFMKNGVEIFTPWSWKTGMWEVLHLFSRYSKKNFVHASSDNEQFVSAYPTLSENNDSLTIFLVNRHLNNSYDIEFELDGFTPKGEPVKMLTLRNLPGNETFSTHEQNALYKSILDQPVYNLKATLQPLSVNAVLLAAAPTNSRLIQNKKINVTVFPNPADENVQFKIALDKKQKLKIDIINATGKIVCNVTHNIYEKGEVYLNKKIGNLETGIYFVKIHFSESIITKKLIIN